MQLPVARTFLGCFDVSLGVKFLLFATLIFNVFCCAMAVADVVLGMPSLFSDVSSTLQVCSVGWCLLGIPIVLLAGWGLQHKLSQLIKLFLAYMVASLCIDFFFLLEALVFKNTCDHLAGVFLPVGSTSAWDCGVVQSVDCCVCGAFLIVTTYFVWIVWSFCEDLDSGGSADLIAELLYGHDNRWREREMKWAAKLAGARRQTLVENTYQFSGHGTPDPHRSTFPCQTPYGVF